MNEKKIRNSSFWLLFTVISSLIIYTDCANLMDTCVLAYKIQIILSTTCWLLYLFWWFVSGKPSSVYIWITWLFFSISFYVYVNMQGRILFLTGTKEEYLTYTSQPLWEWRMFPLTLALIYMLAFIIGRIFGKDDVIYKRRYTD